jgi:hypothetical protein
VLVAPDDQVQEAGQVLLLDGVLALRAPVRVSVLVEHEEAQPLVRGVARRLRWPHPAVVSQSHQGLSANHWSSCLQVHAGSIVTGIAVRAAHKTLSDHFLSI